MTENGDPAPTALAAPRGFGAPDHALPKVEKQAEAFKRDRPALPLGPEAAWGSATG